MICSSRSLDNTEFVYFAALLFYRGEQRNVHVPRIITHVNNCIAKMEVGCLKYPGASTIGSQPLD